jgi:hypothetical protein
LILFTCWKPPVRKSQAQASRRVGLKLAENVTTRAKIDLTTKPAFVSGMFIVSVYLTFLYVGLHLKDPRISVTNCWLRKITKEMEVEIFRTLSLSPEEPNQLINAEDQSNEFIEYQRVYAHKMLITKFTKIRYWQSTLIY